MTESSIIPAPSASADCIPDPIGREEAAEVFFDGIDADGSVCISYKVDFSLEQARLVALRMLELVDQYTPATPAGLEALEVPLQAINDARGTSHTLQSLADECGVDLDHATVADQAQMARHIGGVLMEVRA